MQVVFLEAYSDSCVWDGVEGEEWRMNTCEETVLVPHVWDEESKRERLTHERGRTERWRVTPYHTAMDQSIFFYLNCSSVARKCNKRIIRCELKPLTLFSLPSWNSSVMTQQGSWKIIFVKMAGRIELGLPGSSLIGRILPRGLQYWEHRGEHLDLSLAWVWKKIINSLKLTNPGNSIHRSPT